MILRTFDPGAKVDPPPADGDANTVLLVGNGTPPTSLLILPWEDLEISL